MDQLHVCERCDSDLVQDTDREQRGVGWRARWWVTLKCPECDHVRHVELTQPELNSFDYNLGRARQAIEREAKDLEKTQTADWADAFIAALNDDHVQPDDF